MAFIYGTHSFSSPLWCGFRKFYCDSLCNRLASVVAA